MVMTTRTISISQFKAQCLALLDEVSRTGSPLVVTKYGKPVARVSAVDEQPSLIGSVTYLVDDDALMEPLGDWDAERE